MYTQLYTLAETRRSSFRKSEIERDAKDPDKIRRGGNVSQNTWNLQERKKRKKKKEKQKKEGKKERKTLERVYFSLS